MADDAVEAEFAAALAASAANLSAAIQSATIAATSRVDAAKIEAAATVEAAKAHAAAVSGSAGIQASSNVEAASIQANATIAAANAHAAATQASAALQSAATEAAANVQAAATTAAAATHAAATEAAANVQASATRDAAQASAGATIASANTRAQADVRSADIQATASNYSADKGLIGTEYSSDKQLLGVDHREAGEDRRLNLKLAWAMERWNEVFPLVVDAIGGKQDTLGSEARWALVMATVGAPPPIYTLGVLTPQQVQQQLNAAFARIDTGVGSKVRQAETDLAGRGFSSGSPIMDAIRMGFSGYGIMASADEEAKTRLGAAQANAEQVLRSQTEALEGYLKLIGEYIDLEKNIVQLDVGSLQAVASMIGGVA